MSSARTVSVLASLLWWFSGLYGFVTAESRGWADGLLIGGMALGAIAGGCVFNSLATQAEKLRDLRDRVRHPD